MKLIDDMYLNDQGKNFTHYFTPMQVLCSRSQGNVNSQSCLGSIEKINVNLQKFGSYLENLYRGFNENKRKELSSSSNLVE